jgi:predicted enzyme related to lactoylglutathione lyase
MRINYIPFFTEDMEEQVRFFTETLRFKVVNKANLFANAAGALVQSENNDVLVAITEDKDFKGCKNCIILSTDDCLKDCHYLKAEGLVFTKEPHYLSVGMLAEFTDQFDNRYMLLEERNYNDDL